MIIITDVEKSNSEPLLAEKEVRQKMRERERKIIHYSYSSLKKSRLK